MGFMDLNKILHGIFGSSTYKDIPPPPRPTSHADTNSDTENTSVSSAKTTAHSELEKQTNSEYEKPLASPVPKPSPIKNASSDNNTSSSQTKKPDILSTASGKRTLAVVESLLSKDMNSQQQVSPALSTTSKPSLAPGFHLHSGETIHTLSELEEAAKSMSAEVFSHHVNEQRNDFATWIKHGHNDLVLAEKVFAVSSASELAQVLAKPEEGVASYLESLKQQLHAQVEKSIDEMRSQTKNIDQLREEIASSKQEVATQEQALQKQLERVKKKQQDLQDQMRQLQHQEQTISEKPKQLTSPLIRLRKAISQVQSRISQDQWDLARQEYNNARDAFKDINNLPEHVHDELHQALMELYTTIHLHEIE